MDYASLEYDDSSTIPLEDAYESLLSSRAQAVIPGFTTSDKPLTEEDILCTTNLHTASLFKALNVKYKEHSKTIELYNDRIKELHDSVYKIELCYQELKDRTLEYNKEEHESLAKSFESFHKDILKTKTTIIEIIKKRKDGVENDLEDLSRKLNVIRTLILTGVNEIIKTDDAPKKMCPVCFDNEVSMALVPCGHTYCKGCADMDRSRTAKCPQCRSVINTRVKIFFSL